MILEQRCTNYVKELVMGLEIVLAFVFSLGFYAGYQAAPEQPQPASQKEQVLVSSEIK